MVFWILTTPRSGSNSIVGEIWRRLGGESKPMEYFNIESVAARPDFAPDSAAPVRSYLDYLMARESLGGVLCVKMLWGQLQACCMCIRTSSPNLRAGRLSVCVAATASAKGFRFSSCGRPAPGPRVSLHGG